MVMEDGESTFIFMEGQSVMRTAALAKRLLQYIVVIMTFIKLDQKSFAELPH